MEKSKKLIKPYLKEILLAQEKDEFTINLPFDEDCNLFVFIPKIAILEIRLTPQFQNTLFAILWTLMGDKTIKDIEGGGREDYKKEIEKYMPDFMDKQEKGDIAISLFLDKNADFCLKLFGVDIQFPPLPNNESLNHFRTMVLAAFLSYKHEDFIPFMKRLNRRDR